MLPRLAARTRAAALLCCSLLLAGCGEGPWNNPNPPSPEGMVTYQSMISPAPPKHLDPAISCVSDESLILMQIYEPPMGYHFLKRPYELIERASIDQFFHNPQQACSRKLIDALPDLGHFRAAVAEEPLLVLKDIKVHFPISKGLLQRTVDHTRAVDGVSPAIGHWPAARSCFGASPYRASAASMSCWSGYSWKPSTPGAIRTNSPAGSCSELPSRGHWRTRSGSCSREDWWSRVLRSKS